MKRDENSDPYAYVCPICESRPGDPCKNKRNKVVRPHGARRYMGSPYDPTLERR